MKNLKCLLGFHEWGKPKITRFRIVKQCKRCGKKKENLIPFDILLRTEMLRLTLYSAAFFTILFTQGRDVAETFLKVALEEELKEE